MTYIKTEINFVDYMLDRQSSELYILLVNQRTGSGGTEFIMTVENKKALSEPYDLVFFTKPNAVDAEKREAIVKTLKRALLKYMVDEELTEHISYSVDVSSEEEVISILDPWNAWVVSLGVNGNLNRESQFNSVNLRFNINVNRVTDKHKLLSRVNYNRNESNFVIEGEETISNLQTSFYGNTLYVYSLNENWSAGGVIRYSRSIFENYDHSITVSPAIEYNIFPYSEYANHNFTIRYEIGGRYNDYIDSTTYFKTTEYLGRHRLAVDFQIVKPWGNIDIDAGASQFLTRPKRYSIDINPSVDVNIFKGLNLYTGIYYEITKDRINIPKGDLSVEEILLQNKLRDSNFSMYMYFGIRYRFGSSFNNVVNTRF
ncbi:MAG: hypothetical protein P1U56_01000 [Saprospiraceae bacterium]|nr:hypothetical protein [Saprospiraceae bacterium]